MSWCRLMVCGGVVSMSRGRSSITGGGKVTDRLVKSRVLWSKDP